MADELNTLDSSVQAHKQEDINRHRDEIEELLRLEIISRYYLQEGRIEASLDADPEVQKALEILNDYAAYKALLSAQNPDDAQKTKGN